MHISNWSVRRSGPSMTLKGLAEIADNKFDDVRLAGIKLVEKRGRIVVAVTEDGTEHILRTDH